MAFKKDYYERKQIKHRQRFGKLEKRKDLLERLKKIKENKQRIVEAKNEIETVTGKEYFFKFNKIKSNNNKLYLEENEDFDELKKKLIFVDKEIVRVERKIKTFLNIPCGKKYIFDEDGEKHLVQQENQTGKNENLLKYEDYLKKLFCTRKEISERLLILNASII